MAKTVTTLEKPKKKNLYDLRMFLPYKKTRRKRTKMVVDLGKQQTNQFIQADSRNLKEFVKNETVTLIVTSPPYNCGQEYDLDLTLTEYLDYLNEAWRECLRILRPGGRLCINVPGIGRSPYMPLHAYLTWEILNIRYKNSKFLMRGEIIWDKGQSVGTSTAWGSWCSATNPTLRDVHEYIMVFNKECFNIPKNGNDSDLISEEFTEYTKSIWRFPTENAKRIGHPAPFPEELAKRLIKLYSFPGDLILDPFCGSGTTCIAAERLKREWLGFDISEDYIKLAQTRFKKTFKKRG